MAELRSFPLFVPEYLADTGHLSDAEHGRYLLILMTLWLAPSQRIPNDDEWMARKFRRPVEKVRAELRPIIAEFCTTDGNWISQARLSREWEFCQKMSRRGSGNAKSRWEKEIATRSGTASLQASCNAPDRTGQKEPPNPLGRGEGVVDKSGAEEGATARARGENPRAIDAALADGARRAKVAATWGARIEEFRQTGKWAWGPKPDVSQADPCWQTGTLMPREFVPQLKAAEEELTEWAKACAGWAAGAPWPPGRGNPPDDPATRVPGEIRRKLAGVLKKRTADAPA